MTLVMSASEIEAFLTEVFPQMHQHGKVFTTQEVEPGRVTVLFEPDETHLRPGETLSGPSVFALVDVAAYICVLAHAGPVALAVTSSVTLNFLRKPRLAPHLCEARLLKLGRSLAVIELHVREADRLVAQATATYAIPSGQPKSERTVS